MKQIIKLLILQQIFLFSISFCQVYDDVKDNITKNYEKFFREYKFKIYSLSKEIGYINIKISSTSYSSDKEYFFAEIESYSNIPILSFIIGNTKNYEIEYYDKNFTPTRSYFISYEGNKEYTTTLSVNEKDGGVFEANIKKKGKKNLEKKLTFSVPILTPGNVIPLVTTSWNFEKEESVIYKFVDKNKGELNEVKLIYLGKTKEGFYKIKISLIGINFIIYLDKEKNIIYAKNIAVEVYSEDFLYNKDKIIESSDNTEIK